MNQDKLIPHLFRSEFRNMASVLTRHFGIEHLQVAEDIASETFLTALETWSYKGVPENPKAWLYKVAKNKALNYQNRNNLFNKKIAAQIKANSVRAEIDFSEAQVQDSQLQMLFALCHPAIPVEAQVGLALRILCGFGIDEIASAFITNKEVINKRLYRAKEKLCEVRMKLETPDTNEINNRLENVLLTLYLLFSEGYYSECNDAVLREDFCLEAMRLTHLLIENSQTNHPAANALMALMCFHASRFPARKNNAGQIVLYHDQDASLWNQELIARGLFILARQQPETNFRATTLKPALHGGIHKKMIHPKSGKTFYNFIIGCCKSVTHPWLHLIAPLLWPKQTDLRKR